MTGYIIAVAGVKDKLGLVAGFYPIVVEGSFKWWRVNSVCLVVIIRFGNASQYRDDANDGALHPDWFLGQGAVDIGVYLTAGIDWSCLGYISRL